MLEISAYPGIFKILESFTGFNDPQEIGDAVGFLDVHDILISPFRYFSLNIKTGNKLDDEVGIIDVIERYLQMIVAVVGRITGTVSQKTAGQIALGTAVFQNDGKSRMR